MQIMLFWTAAIGWRRYYQGILVRNGLTRFVSLCTTFRLLGIVMTVVTLASRGRLSGVQVAACGLMVGVLLRLPGMWVGAGAFSLAALTEYLIDCTSFALILNLAKPTTGSVLIMLIAKLYRQSALCYTVIGGNP